MPSNFLECMLFKLVTFINCLLNLLRTCVLKFESNKKQVPKETSATVWVVKMSPVIQDKTVNIVS